MAGEVVLRQCNTAQCGRAQRSGGDDVTVVQFQQRAHPIEEKELLAVQPYVLDVGRNGI